MFGCLLYVSTHSVGINKLDLRSQKRVFLGFKPGTKGYVLYDIHSKSIIVPHNVLFHETIFPYPASLSPPHDSLVAYPSTNNDLFHFDIPISSATTTGNNDISNIPTSDTSQIAVHDTSHLTASDNTQTKVLRTSNRLKNRPRYLQNYYCGSASTSDSAFSTPYLIHHFLSYDKCSSNHTSFCHNISAQGEPSSYKEAIQSDY